MYRVCCDCCCCYCCIAHTGRYRCCFVYLESVLRRARTHTHQYSLMHYTHRHYTHTHTRARIDSTQVDRKIVSASVCAHTADCAHVRSPLNFSSKLCKAHIQHVSILFSIQHDFCCCWFGLVCVKLTRLGFVLCFSLLNNSQFSLVDLLLWSIKDAYYILYSFTRKIHKNYKYKFIKKENTINKIKARAKKNPQLWDNTDLSESCLSADIFWF